jgi:predicted transcriptional regulator of viral defense system
MLMSYAPVTQLAARGQLCFRWEDVQEITQSSEIAVKASLRRVKNKGEIAMPYRGFYVFVPPEYRVLGCRPAEQFIPDMMKTLGEVYYAGLLTAAEYHGAAHHRPQRFQVLTSGVRRPVRCGKIQVEFIHRTNAGEIPVDERNTVAGTIRVSTPEATALDLVVYARRCGGLDNVATVLGELAEKIDSNRLIEVARYSPLSCLQRLGFLLDLVGAKDTARIVADFIQGNAPLPTPLSRSAPHKGAKMDPRWRVYINAKVEPET